MESRSSGALKAIPLLVVTLVFIGYFINSFADVELNNIRRDWNTRRCEPLIMLLASKVPTDPEVDRDEFSSQNFKFCLNKIIDSAITPLFTPIMGIFKNQLNVAGVVQSSINGLKLSASSLVTPFSELMGSFNGKLTNIVYQIVRSFYKLGSAFDRANAVAFSAVFGGMAMWKGMDNYIRFIASVIVTILVVLVVLVIFLWFVLFPFIPLIITTIGVVSYILGEASTAGMAGSFCVDEGTLVQMKDGWKKVEEIEPGDDLDKTSGKVEGVLKTIGGPGGKYVDIEGVLLSESHMVLEGDKWVFAKDHTMAKAANKIPERLYCLNTTSRQWIVKKDENSPTLILRDWEELPDSEQADIDWELLIFEILNRKTIIPPVEWSSPGRGLFGPETLVEVKGKGLIPISQVSIGDYVKGTAESNAESTAESTAFTQVAGVYRDCFSIVPRAGPNSSVWCWLDGKDVWRHPLTQAKEEISDGCLLQKSAQSIRTATPPAAASQCSYNLITESGTFIIYDKNMYLKVRDFTEVGWDRIETTYSFSKGHLENI